MLTPHALLTAIIEDGHWDMDWAHEYAEPGYTAGKKGVLFANWNDENIRSDGPTKANNYTENGHWYKKNKFRSRAWQS